MPDCEKSLLREMETFGEEPDEGDDDTKKEPITCGLTTSYDAIGDAISEKAYEGFYPHLFGLGMPPLVGGDGSTKPVHDRMAGRLQVETDDDDEQDGGQPPAITQAMESLVRDAEAGQPRALVIVGMGEMAISIGLKSRVQVSRTTVSPSIRLQLGVNSTQEPSEADFQSKSATESVRSV